MKPRHPPLRGSLLQSQVSVSDFVADAQGSGEGGGRSWCWEPRLLPPYMPPDYRVIMDKPALNLSVPIWRMDEIGVKNSEEFSLFPQP